MARHSLAIIDFFNVIFKFTRVVILLRRCCHRCRRRQVLLHTKTTSTHSTPSKQIIFDLNTENGRMH